MLNSNETRPLTTLEHIRKRPGMYLNLRPDSMYIGEFGNGSNPDDGIYTMLKGVIDNSVDEYIMGSGQCIDIKIADDNRVTVRDFGRGIPSNRLVESVSEIRTGVKSNTFPLSVRLRKIGLKVVNALSSCFTITTFYDGQMTTVTFKKGACTGSKSGNSIEKNGTLVEFLPDKEFFEDFTFHPDLIRKMMQRYACLNDDLKLSFNGELFHAKNGLLDLPDLQINNSVLYPHLHYKDDILEIAFSHVDDGVTTFYSFVNGVFTTKGGEHLSACYEGIIQGVNVFYSKNFTNKDIRAGLTGAIAVKIVDPVMENTGTRHDRLNFLENRTEIVKQICNVVIDRLNNDNSLAEIVLDRICR